jgi:hypothetical protein
MIDEECDDPGHESDLPPTSLFGDGETVTVTADTTPIDMGGSGEQVTAPPALSLVPPIPSVPVFDLGAYRKYKRTAKEQKLLDWLTVGAVVAVALLLIAWIAGDVEVGT